MSVYFAEEWRAIPKAPGYEVSNMGRVRSFRRGAPVGGRILQPANTGHNGNYRVVRINFAGKWQTRLVHQLVLEGFVGPRPDWATDVRHLNGSGADNRLANLAYGTREENSRDAVVVHRTHWNTAKTRCKRGHEFTLENTIPGQGALGATRACRTCRRASQRAYKQRQHATIPRPSSLTR